MITKDIDTIRYQAQEKLAYLGESNSKAYADGKVNEDDVEKGLSIISLLYALDYKDFLTEEEKENILYCLVQVAEINAFPSVPAINPVPKPDILVGIPGPKGDKGDKGDPGKDYVDVIPDTSYDNIKVTESDIGGIKTFALAYDPYVAPVASMSVTSSKVVEIGASNDINFTAQYTKGRENITSQTIDSPITPAWTTNPQSFTDSNVVINSRNTRQYKCSVGDGKTTDSDTDNVDFVYPFFWGSSASILAGSDIYSNLTKKLEKAGDKSIAINITDQYFYFCFPADYDDSNIEILDENGFNITSAFTVTTENVTSGTSLSGGGGTDWTKSYKIYRLTNKTDINGTWKFNNVTE